MASSAPDRNTTPPEKEPAQQQSVSSTTTASSSSTTRKRKRYSRTYQEPLHPYLDKVDKIILRIKADSKRLFQLSDNDLVLCNVLSGANNYDPNLDFATKLECVAKKLIDLSNKCSKNASKIRDKVDMFKNKKCEKEGIICLGEVTDPRLKHEKTWDRRPERMRYTREIKTEAPQPRRATYVSSDESGVEYEGCPDTRFKYTKKNSNDASKTQFQCHVKTCLKVLRDSSELNNHMSVHQCDLFRCMKCYNVFRTTESFKFHMEVHTGTELRCKVCKQRFDRKTSLSNHMQKHSDKSAIVCPTCNKRFRYRQNGLEHVQWFHRENKEVPCPICKKLFQMPTYMRSHRARRHGLVSDIFYPSD